jgi:hypothetical protein
MVERQAGRVEMGPNRVNFIASREAHHVRLSSQASQDHAKFMCKDILVQTLAARLAEDGKEQSSQSTISITIIFLFFPLIPTIALITVHFSSSRSQMSLPLL